MDTHWFALFLTKNASIYMLIAKTPITELAFNITNSEWTLFLKATLNR